MAGSLTTALHAPEGLKHVETVDGKPIPNSYMHKDKNTSVLIYSRAAAHYSEYMMANLDLNNLANFPDLGSAAARAHLHLPGWFYHLVLMWVYWQQQVKE